MRDKRPNCIRSRGNEQTPDQNQQLSAALGLLNTKEYEAKAGNDDEEAELEILTAMQEPVPRPDALREGHRENLNSHQEEKDAAHTRG